MGNSRWFWMGVALSITAGFILIFGVIFPLWAGADMFSLPSAFAQGESPTATPLPVQQATTAAQPVAPPPAEPPLPEQGGTCITGSVIDIYHQFVGAGWKVTATSAQGVSVSATVGANGQYRFDNLSRGVWTVALELPFNWQPFTAASFQVSLSGDPKNLDCAQVRNKCIRPACLDVTKLDARDTGGIKFGIPGWRMTAVNGPATLTGITDAQGKIYWKNMTPGTWTVTEEDKLGWIPFHNQTNQQTIVLATPRADGICGQLTFINHQIHTASIRVLKIRQDTLQPLPGWSITVTRDDGTQKPMTQVTNQDGWAVFENLALGDWTVTEQVRPLWEAVGPTEQKVKLALPNHDVQVTFRNRPLPPIGCIDGFKINHLDQGLPNWKITVINQDNNQAFYTLTDQAGHFQIEVPLGRWKVFETIQTGWEPVTPPELEVYVNKPLPACEHVRFKNKTNYACVDVFKKDAFLNSGLPGWEITVQPAYGGSPRVDKTDGTGFVRFNGLTPGTYIITEKMQAGWTADSPQSVTRTLEASGLCPVVTFKNHQTDAPFPASPPPRSSTCRATHRVAWGNSLGTIAAQYNTTVEAIKQANNMTSNIITINQQLCIP